MLSRVAEALFWMARYIERAEDLTRLLAVNFNALLDVQPQEAARSWAPLVAITGDEALFTELYGAPTAAAAIDFLLWQPLNPNAVTTCLTRARENARAVREQISSEMWEHLNRLYFFAKEVDRDAVLNSPHEFFQKVRDGSQAFEGVTAATMTHNEPYEFITLGRYLERTDKTVRILEVKYNDVSRLPEGSAEAALQLIALLRSCSAFEPFRRTGRNLQADLIAEYLLLSREFPRAVLFCVNHCVQALDRFGDASHQAKPDHPRRTLGRLSANLEYLDIQVVLGTNLDAYLAQLLLRLNTVGDELARTYFNTQVILPDERPRQQQQQQQQQ